MARKIQTELKDRSWNWLARGAPRALAAFRATNGITLIGKAVALNAVPLTALTVIHQIKTRKACVQINADVDGKKLRLDWNLVYSPSALKRPKRDDELTRAKVRDREERTLRGDKLRIRYLNLRCDADGDVDREGTASRVFSTPLTVGGR